MKKYALVSVYDKSKLSLLCKNLHKFNIGIISTGSTSKKIKSLGYECFEISKFTKSKEILGGRVKSIHPNIYAFPNGSYNNFQLDYASNSSYKFAIFFIYLI